MCAERVAHACCRQRLRFAANPTSDGPTLQPDCHESYTVYSAVTEMTIGAMILRMVCAARAHQDCSPNAGLETLPGRISRQAARRDCNSTPSINIKILLPNHSIMRGASEGVIGGGTQAIGGPLALYPEEFRERTWIVFRETKMGQWHTGVRLGMRDAYTLRQKRG